MQNNNGILLTVLRGKDHDPRLLYLAVSEVANYCGSQRDQLAEIKLILGNHNGKRENELKKNVYHNSQMTSMKYLKTTTSFAFLPRRVFSCRSVLCQCITPRVKPASRMLQPWRGRPSSGEIEQLSD